MRTSAEQIHQGKVNMAPAKKSEERLYIDLDICATGQCSDCTLQCSYLYHSANNGIVSIAELAAYYLVCRRCTEAHCVKACPKEALEQQSDKDRMLIRHNLRCVSCKSCAHACPYGTIYPQQVPLLIHNCDFCLGRRERQDEPLCIKTCPYGALKLQMADADLGENCFFVGDNLIIHSTHWRNEQA